MKPFTLSSASLTLDAPTRRDIEFTWAVRATTNTPILGFIRLRNDAESRSDLGFRIGAEHRKNGDATAAARLCREYLVGNYGSAALERRAGLRYKGIAPSALPTPRRVAPYCMERRAEAQPSEARASLVATVIGHS